uniref:Uncharacterized protein n=1 Tax=Aegilops tauschii TaxID=37682 RepID=M8C4N8_AEGTA
MVSFAAATFSMLDWKEKATKRIMKVQNNGSGGEWDRLVIQAVLVTRTIVDVAGEHLEENKRIDHQSQ